MSNQIELLKNINVNSEMFNELVNKTTEIMKISIIQSIMNESNSSKIVKRSIDTKSDISTTYLKTSVGTVVTDRFKKMTPEVKNIVARNIRSIKSAQLRLNDKVMSSRLDNIKGTIGLNPINLKILTTTRGPISLNQIDLKSEFPLLSTEKSFHSLIVQARDLLDRINHHGHGGSHIVNDNDSNNDNSDTPSDPPIILNKGLKLKLHSVKCLDETDPERWGSDEISMGGVTLNDKSVEETINEFEIYDDFDDNEVKAYTPPRILAQFNNLDSSYPKIFTAFIALAENDNGGFSDFILKLYDAIKNDLGVIIKALGAAAGAWIGGELGGSVGSLAGPIGAIIGAVVGAILGALIAWAAEAIKDDIFPTQQTAITIPSGNAVFSNGGLESPIESLTYEAFGGKYEVRYSWEIVR